MRPVYRLYIDESGDHTYGKKEKSPIFIRHGEEKHQLGDINTFPQLEKLDKRYFGLTGCIFRLDYYRESFVPTMDAFKRDFFDPDEQIILHAKDIMQRRGSFHILQNEETTKRFDAGIIDLVSNADYSIINVVIDKKNHIEKFGNIAWHPYHYCLAVMLERFCFFLKAARARGDVLAESRGGSEDHELKNAYARIFTSGTRFKSGAFFSQYLTSKEIKIKPKHNNVAGLQIADILTHPIKKLTLINYEIIPTPENDFFWLRIIDVARPKFYRNSVDGRVDGYGLVFLK